MTACLVVEDWNGKMFVSLYADKKTIPGWVKDRQEAGFIRMLDIPDADLAYGLDILRRIYLQNVSAQPKTAEQVKAEEASTQAAEHEALKMKKSELIRVLDRIIRESNQQGEAD